MNSLNYTTSKPHLASQDKKIQEKVNEYQQRSGSVDYNPSTAANYEKIMKEANK